MFFCNNCIALGLTNARLFYDNLKNNKNTIYFKIYTECNSTLSKSVIMRWQPLSLETQTDKQTNRKKKKEKRKNKKKTNMNIQTQLRRLQQEYDVTLLKYQEAVQNYIVLLKSTTNTTSSRITSLPGRTWWGKQRLQEGPANTQEDCENMCLQSSKCSGATFNTVKHYCWTRTGDTNVTVGKDSDVALVSEQKIAVIRMQELNKQLIQLNVQISDLFEQAQPSMEQQQKEQQLTKTQLEQTRIQLNQQQQEMKRQLQEYNTLQQDMTDQDLYTTQQQLWLYILLSCGIVCLYHFS